MLTISNIPSIGECEGEVSDEAGDRVSLQGANPALPHIPGRNPEHQRRYQYKCII